MNNSTVDINPTECSSSVSTALTGILSIVSLLALTGNLLVIITVIKDLSLKISSNYYIVNMALSDLVCVILNWPVYATEGMLKPGGSLITNTVLASFACKLGLYSRAVSYVVSILSLVLIAVDRFIATAFPLKVLHSNGRSRKILYLFLSWFLPAIAFAPFIVHAKVIEIGKQSFCRNMMSVLWLKTYYFLGFVVFYCAPLILIVVLYPLIMKHLRTNRAQMDDTERRATRTKRLKQDKNIMKIFGSIVFGFFICWTPHYIYLFLKTLHPSIFLSDKCLLLVGLFFYIFPLLSSALNPFILIAFSSSYRAAVKNLLSRLFPKCRSARIEPRITSHQGQTLETLELN